MVVQVKSQGSDSYLQNVEPKVLQDFYYRMGIRKSGPLQQALWSPHILICRHKSRDILLLLFVCTGNQGCKIYQDQSWEISICQFPIQERKQNNVCISYDSPH